MASTQFKSTDTTPWWLGYGDGSDGAYSSSGNATDAPVDSSCSGTVDTTSLSATNASFANGKPILIHQSRGTGAGSWELNQIASYTAGTITTVSPLKNTYTDSGASQAQVIQLKQYSSFTQNSGHTLTAKAWNGNVGGIIAFLCNGEVTVTGTLSNKGTTNPGEGVRNNGGGYRGGVSYDETNSYGGVGESTAGDNNNASPSASANGGGGGGGNAFYNAGGGGGNGSAGSAGENSGSTNGAGGATAGNAALTTMVFGGGGGGATGTAGMSNNVQGGVNGGGIIAIFARSITVTGSINAGGTDRTDNNIRANGGGGAGGSIILKCQTATLGTNLVLAKGSVIIHAAEKGGNGGDGRIHLDYLTSYTGTTTPTIDVTQDYSLSGGGTGILITF